MKLNRRSQLNVRCLIPICKRAVSTRSSTQRPPHKSTERVPSNYWSSVSNQRTFFDVLGKHIGINTLDDWYSKLNKKVVTDNGGATILSHHSSLIAALTSCYPEHNWQPWKFSIITRGYWNSVENQRLFLDWLAKELGLKTLDDWTSISAYVVVRQGGIFVNTLYNGSLFETLKTCYPEHSWNPASFYSWANKENQRTFFDQLAKKAGVHTLDDWYSKFNAKLVRDNKGYFFQHHYRGSAIDALMAAFPDHNWLPWKFRHTSRGYWKSPHNRKKFFDWLGKELGVKELDDWYKVFCLDDILEHSGHALQKIQSPLISLMESYPQHKWDISKFQKGNAPQGYWHSFENASKMLADLSDKLSIRTLDDWYRVSFDQLRQFGAVHVILKYGGLYNVLRQQYPDHPWDKQKFKSVKKTQRWLLVNLQKLYPNEEIIEDFIHPKAKYENSQKPMQLDAFLPGLSLAFEYHGAQHFQDVNGLFQPSRVYRQRDEEKRKLCVEWDITLVEVPYWWNGTEENLKHIINSAQSEGRRLIQ